MKDKINYNVFAVKAIQPGEEGSEYWIPRLYKELQNGRARFGWSYYDDADLRKIKQKIERGEQLSEDERGSWRAKFMLEEAKPGDYFVYINMPEYGKCTIVKITGEYEFTDIWDDERKNDFRHCIPCEYIAEFNRNDDIVHPYLRVRLGLRGRYWRLYDDAKVYFQELLEALKGEKPAEGKSPKERLKDEIERHLLNMSNEVIHRLFPGKNLEDLLIEVFKNVPNVVDVRKGPDINGVDIEIEFEQGLEIPGLTTRELCAVQVKSYEGEMGNLDAIEDIKRAFESNPDYTCGLIVSTATSMAENVEKELEKLMETTGKKVGVLLGKDLAKFIIKYGYENIV